MTEIPSGNTGSDDPVEAEEPKRSSRRKWVACAAAGAALAGAAVSMVETGWGKQIEQNYAFNTKSCPSVSTTDLRKTDEELSAPVAPGFGNILRSRDGRSYTLGYRNYIEVQARDNGLTLVDDTPYQVQLAEAKTSQDVLDVLSKFTANYGFSVGIGPADGTGKNDWLPMHEKDVLIELKTGAFNMMEYFHYLPVELVKFSKLKRVEIVNELEPNIAGEASVEGVISVTFDTFGYGDYETYMHEEGHEIDYAGCGADDIVDKQFTVYNPKGFKYGGKVKWRGVTATQHGALDPMEDKAELYKDMITMLAPNAFNTSSPVINAKYRLLLTRLDKEVPGIENYYLSISPRHKNKKIQLGEAGEATFGLGEVGVSALTTEIKHY